MTDFGIDLTFSNTTDIEMSTQISNSFKYADTNIYIVSSQKSQYALTRGATVTGRMRACRKLLLWGALLVW